MVRFTGEKAANILHTKTTGRLAAILLAPALALLSVPGQVSAEIHEDALFEVSIGGGLSVPVDDFKEFRFADFNGDLGAGNGFHVDASGGYFLLDQLSIGVSLAFSQFGIDNPATDLKYRIYSVGAYGKYHFGYESRVTPYIRLQAGIAVPNFSTPLRTPGLAFRENPYDLRAEARASLGARISTSEWGGFFIEAGVRYSDVAESESDFKQEIYEIPVDAAQFQLTAGFSFDIGAGE
ncbi:MAG: outer membrane beta-barrel protein [Candidatus Zixiibacteriota bacterium]